ncbi:CmlA/FloR family chloramphenicol efflux MFS transporter [Zavarzinia sp. CC-PAN008]|uniref:CmlA/FloR family chloramphenicol efflux MFS transporter n=1 Tax=Zavarzinia sp. CC-PAN008 TaxID=3243332 RepID=UPI003F744951
MLDPLRPRPAGTWSLGLVPALFLMAPFDVLASLGMDIYLPVVPEMPAILGTTPGVVQFTLTLYILMLGVGQVVFGPLSDRIGRRPVLLGGASLFAVASFALAMTGEAGPFLVLRTLQAVGAAAMLVAVFATVRDAYAGRAESAAIYGLLNGVLAFVPALGPVAGAAIADAAGWRTIFVLLGVLALVQGLIALAAWPETRAGGPPPRTGFAAILRSGAFWAYTLAFGTAMGTFFVFLSSAPRVLMDKAGLERMTFSLAFASVAVVMIVVARLARTRIAAWGTAGSVRRGMGLLVLGSALLAGLHAWAPGSAAAFVLPMWVMAVGIVLATSVTANGALQAFGHVAGAAVALHFCAQSVIVGIAGSGAVLLLDGGTAWPLAGFASVMPVLTLLALSRLDGSRD